MGLFVWVAFFIWGDAREACAFCGWHIKMGVWWWSDGRGWGVSAALDTWEERLSLMVSDGWGMGVGAVLDALRVSNNEIIFG